MTPAQCLEKRLLHAQQDHVGTIHGSLYREMHWRQGPPSGSVSSVKETPWKEFEKAAKAVLPSMGTGTLGPWHTMVATARLVPPAAPVTHIHSLS